MTGSDLYIKLTDPTGASRDLISHHRVWDGPRFMAATRERFEVKATGGDVRKVSQATEADYRKFMNDKAA